MLTIYKYHRSKRLLLMIKKNQVSEIFKKTLIIILFFIIYFTLVYGFNLFSFSSEQQSLLFDFLITFGFPDRKSAYFDLFDSIFISYHCILTLLILSVAYFVVWLYRRTKNENTESILTTIKNKINFKKLAIYSLLFIVVFVLLLCFVPLYNFSDAQHHAFRDFLVSLGMHDSYPAYRFVYNSVYAFIHALASLCVVLFTYDAIKIFKSILNK
ncbi:hypothetical protein KNO33_01005 [Taylorella equigenitalis]|uniref:Uncharacterized protein n=3 Tax=Taylorella equigenitalis TaxID=29575 RepID=A0A654KH63_TAYEM|nr:hypothetical protein TEQUI_0836 [Taylorella equigenitalis MCE9]WDU46591.1 hypothetical protein KNO33_01005 [Taylorella equigenitalis]